MIQITSDSYVMVFFFSFKTILLCARTDEARSNEFTGFHFKLYVKKRKNRCPRSQNFVFAKTQSCLFFEKFYCLDQFISINLNIFPPTFPLKIIATLSVTTIRRTTWPTVFTQFFLFQTRMIESGLRFDYSLLVPQPQIVPGNFTGWFSNNVTKMNKNIP